MPLPRPSNDNPTSARQQFSLGSEISSQYRALVKSASVSETESRVYDVETRANDDRVATLQSKNSMLLDTSYELVLEQNRTLREIIEALGSMGGDEGDASSRIPRRVPRRTGPRTYGKVRENEARRRLRRMQDAQRQQRRDRLRKAIGIGPNQRELDRRQARRVQAEQIARRDYRQSLQRDNASRLRNLTPAQVSALRSRGITISQNNVVQREPRPGERGRPFVSASELNRALDAVTRPSALRAAAGAVGRAGVGVGAGAAVGGVLGLITAEAIRRGTNGAVDARREMALAGLRAGAGTAAAAVALRAGVVLAGRVAEERVVRGVAGPIITRTVASGALRRLPIVGTILGVAESVRRATHGEMTAALRVLRTTALYLAGQAATTVTLGGGVIITALAIASEIDDIVKSIKESVYHGIYRVSYEHDTDPMREQRMANVEQILATMIREVFVGITEDEMRTLDGYLMERARARFSNVPDIINEADPVRREILMRLHEAMQRANNPGQLGRAANNAVENIQRELDDYDRSRGRSPQGRSEEQRRAFSEAADEEDRSLGLAMMSARQADRPSEDLTRLPNESTREYNQRVRERQRSLLRNLSNDVGDGDSLTPLSIFTNPFERDTIEFDELKFDADKIIFEGDIARDENGMLPAALPISAPVPSPPAGTAASPGGESGQPAGAPPAAPGQQPPLQGQEEGALPPPPGAGPAATPVGRPSTTGREPLTPATGTDSRAGTERRRRSPEEFAREFLPYAESVSSRIGVPASIILSHWANETGYGRSFAGQNNLANMTGTRREPTTQGADRDAQGRPITQPFLNFSSLQEFADRYANWIMRRTGPMNTNDPADFGRRLSAAGFAPNPEHVGQAIAGVHSRLSGVTNRVAPAPGAGGALNRGSTETEAERQRRARTAPAPAPERRSDVQQSNPNFDMAMVKTQHEDPPLRVRLLQSVG